MSARQAKWVAIYETTLFRRVKACSHKIKAVCFRLYSGLPDVLEWIRNRAR